MHTVFKFESLKGRDHLEDLVIDEKTILECILWEGLDRMCVAQEHGEHGNEPSGSIKNGEFLA
jgi:hypothetical protein